MSNNVTKTRVFIIGTGPAGYTSAIYASRANLSPLVIEGIQPGGQLTTTTEIENFPGFPEGITGVELMDLMKKQAERFGARFITGEVTSIDLSKRPFTAQINNGESVVEAETVVIATGASARYLGLPDENKYAGMGVSACATCDGFFYRNQKVAVVGGGDTACEEAIYLSSLASKVYMIVRRDELRASKVMADRVMNNPKIEVLWNTQTEGLYGENGVAGAHLVKNKGKENEEHYDLEIDGFFLAIGHKPNTDFLSGQITLDETGYIKTVEGTVRTNIDGVYAAGDCADPHYRQAITSAGTGCQAAIEAERFLACH
ncbi:MAG: thioredoxin-disulfide reductase [Porphyromonas sp.]|nr:thioredoxin-disulfide reductase [Bacteroidales bacterium]MDD7558719.1 thioredoxin-disulfide reductase [Bacteroidales bacterium]MDY3099798.1 thioredoxin-disulfide reductase [Porphyromonas sp.]